MSRATGAHPIDPPMSFWGGDTPTTFRWEVRFSRIETRKGNYRSSVPPFRDQEMVDLTWQWLVDNIHAGFAFKDKHTIIFEDETDALLCYTNYA